MSECPNCQEGCYICNAVLACGNLTASEGGATLVLCKSRSIPNSQFPISNYQLPITNYQSPITNYQLPITNYQLPITNYQLPVNS